MRVVVSTIGRFHSFNLAYELQQEGHLEAIFTSLPLFRVRGLRVDPRRIRTFPWLMTPHRALSRLQRYAETRLAREVDWQAKLLHDQAVARRLPECDVISALSSCGLITGRMARQRGAGYVCDRGSTHIVVQDCLLREEHDLLGVPYAGIDRRVIEREQEEYETADRITIPSTFALRSFVQMGVPPDKLRLVPYGVDLRDFSPCFPRAKQFRILFAGALSIRKGLHYLLGAFAKACLPNARLVLLGQPLPETNVLFRRFPVEDVERLGVVDWSVVAREMSRSSVLVLPSIEDGFGLVLAQALACGCPVIATTNTGAEDLFIDGVEGFVVPIRDPMAIADRLTRLYLDRELLDQMSTAALKRVRTVGGWASYGRRSIGVFRESMRAQETNPSAVARASPSSCL